jgi:hypothetical protein
MVYELCGARFRRPTDGSLSGMSRPIASPGQDATPRLDQHGAANHRHRREVKGAKTARTPRNFLDERWPCPFTPCCPKCQAVRSFRINDQSREVSMEVANKRVVEIDYTLKDAEGNVLDSSEGREPLAFVQFADGSGGS